MDNKLQKSINRAISLLNTSSKYEDYISLKLSPLSPGCCCSHCWPETWQTINQFIAPFVPVQHEDDALIEKDGNKFVLESHESGLEIIFLIDLIKTSADCLKSIIELIIVSVNAISQEKRKQPARIKISKKQIIKGIIDEENLVEIDLPLSKDIEKKLQNKLKNLLDEKPCSSRKKNRDTSLFS
ncbi:hypothetical protein KAI19_01945 [bacterium]|nr:hypothetical protein [bacterium]